MSIKILTKPKIEIDPDLLKQLEAQTQEKGQVVLHFLFETVEENYFIRIWPTTFLYDQDSTYKSDLIHFENISLYPSWTFCHIGTKNFFTLIFTGLPKSCTTFDFIEECHGATGAFEVRNIARNQTDVYFIKLLQS
jgi:hypothetical protein